LAHGPLLQRWGLCPWHLRCHVTFTEMAEPLTVVFRTKTGDEEVRIFTQQPLGMEFRRVMPIVISRLRGEGQAIQFGVQLGWEVVSINGNALAGMKFPDAFDIFVAAADMLPRCMLVRRCPLDSKSTPLLANKLKIVEEVEVVPLLQAFGFNALSADAWGDKAQRPDLVLGVIDGHREKGRPSHTWYAIIGKVQVTPGETSSTRRWVVERRLAHIRALLHDPVKREMGKDYDFHFKGAHFAHHGGPPGTTARMEAWLGKLARAIYAGEVSPALVASILRFLEAPKLDEDAGQTVLEGAPAFEKAFAADVQAISGTPATAASTSQASDQQEEPPIQDNPDDKTDSGSDDGAEEDAEEVAEEVAEQADGSNISRQTPTLSREKGEDLNEAALVMCL